MRAGLAIVWLVAAILPASAAGRAPYEGVWSLKAAYCTRKPPETGNYPVNITRKGWTGYEYWCDFLSERREGQTFVLEARCGGEGNEENAVIRMRRAGRDLLIQSPDGQFLRHVRCRACDNPGRANSYPCRAMPEPGAHAE